MSRFTSMSFLLLSGVGLLAACGEDKPAETGQPAAVQCPPGQIYDGRLCQTVGPPGATTTPTATAPAATTAPTATLPTTIPGVATTTSGPTASPVDPAVAQAAVLLLPNLGQQHAPAGAKPVGSAIAGNFQQGQSLESQFQMNPGKCYTIVGVGLPQITNLDLSIVPALPIPGITMAADNTVGATSVLGEKTACIRNYGGPISVMVKLVITASQGAGMAAAQVFEANAPR